MHSGSVLPSAHTPALSPMATLTSIKCKDAACALGVMQAAIEEAQRARSLAREARRQAERAKRQVRADERGRTRPRMTVPGLCRAVTWCVCVCV